MICKGTHSLDFILKLQHEQNFNVKVPEDVGLQCASVRQ